jgi:mRNA-degrading endonuclease toxin of MazEF toxin-antitoxin module
MAPITTTLRPIRTWVQLEASDGIPQRSCINLDSIQTVRIERVGAYITGLPTARMEEVGRAIAFALGLDT